MDSCNECDFLTKEETAPGRAASFFHDSTAPFDTEREFGMVDYGYRGRGQPWKGGDPTCARNCTPLS